MYELNSPTLSIKLIGQTMPRMTRVQRRLNCPPTSFLWRHRHLHGKEGRHMAYWTMGLCKKMRFSHLDIESQKVWLRVYQLLVLFFVPATSVAWMFIHCWSKFDWKHVKTIHPDQKHDLELDFEIIIGWIAMQPMPQNSNAACSQAAALPKQNMYRPWLTLHLSLKQCLHMPWKSKTKWSKEKGVDYLHIFRCFTWKYGRLVNS